MGPRTTSMRSIWAGEGRLVFASWLKLRIIPPAMPGPTCATPSTRISV